MKKKMECKSNLFLFLIFSITWRYIPRADGAVNKSTKLEDAPKPFKDERPVVRIKTQGLVRGRRASDGPFYEYLGIPYAATSPKSRFLAPGPAPTWDGIKDADNGDKVCPQIDWFTEKFIGEEDCLTVNVYTPLNITSRSNLAVMVYIHGGIFESEQPEKSFTRPNRYMDEKVIIVYFKYRLNIVGFLCNREAANAGLKDAVAVLKWVRDNIEGFGGDPRKVTLMGHSSGSVMVELLVLSKQTEGLFASAIAQSGSATSRFLSENPGNIAYDVAKELGYEGRDHVEMMNVLRNANISDLVTTFNKIPKGKLAYCSIAPCVEQESNNDAIIANDPFKIIESGEYNDVPYIKGITKNEGFLMYEDNKLKLNYINNLILNFSHTFPIDLQFDSSMERERATQVIRQFYFDGKNINETHFDKLAEYMGDVMYVWPTINSMKSYSKTNRTSPLYLYEFDYDGGMPMFKHVFNISHLSGVFHADELGYLWTAHSFSPKMENDELIAQRMIKMWTNFAKYGDPTPDTSELLPVKWETGEDLKYLSIDTTLKMQQTPFKDRMDFWKTIYRRFGASKVEP